MNASPETIVFRPTELTAAKRYLIEIAVIAGAYFLLAKFGLMLASINPSATPIWPPTGLALAAVLLRGYRVWPAILVGAFIANAATAGTLGTSFAIGIGNTLEGVLGAYLINRWSNGRETFATPAGVARFAAISLLPTAASATIGVLTLSLSGHAAWANFSSIWITWWLGDLAGALVFAPVIVLWAAAGREAFTSDALVKSGVVFAIAAVIGLVAFSPLIEQSAWRAPLGFLSVLPLMWAALRRGPRDTATVAFLLSCFAVWGTLFNGGPFIRGDLNESFLLLLMFLMSVTVPSLALSAEVENLHGLHKEMDRRVQQRTEALALAREQLTQSQKLEAIGQLTGGIAHDFNNLLMIVSGHAQLLQRRLSSPKDTQAVEAIQSAAKRGESLTRQLLTFSRRQQLNPTVVDLGHRVEAVREMLSSSLRDNIELAIEISREIWPVEVDVSELELALVNIAVNARDAMPNGGTVRLLVRNATIEPGRPGSEISGEFVALSMSDSGSGIAPDVLAKVFEPFFTTKAVGKGTGLGLAQVYGFARQSGGDVTITTELGTGTTVTILLPRSSAAVAAVAAHDDVLDGERQRGAILVVEDNPDVGAVTASLLEQIGYRVQRADGANEALQILGRGKKFDLVFSDIVMPGEVSGVALARVIEERYPNIRVLLTTGYNDVESSIDHEFPILRKPFELTALQSVIREMLAASSASEDVRASRRVAGQKVG